MDEAFLAHHNLTKPSRGHTPQLFAYEFCLKKYKKLHQFIGFIDIDEYIVLAGWPSTSLKGKRGADKSKPTRIQQVLTHFESYGGLALNWMMMGDRNNIASRNSINTGTHVHRNISGLNLSQERKFPGIPDTPHYNKTFEDSSMNGSGKSSIPHKENNLKESAKKYVLDYPFTDCGRNPHIKSIVNTRFVTKRGSKSILF